MIKVQIHEPFKDRNEPTFRMMMRNVRITSNRLESSLQTQMILIIYSLV